MSRKSKERKRRQKFQGEGPMGVIHISALDATRMARPKYDGFVCRGGVHGDTKYNRRSFKAQTRRIIDEG